MVCVCVCVGECLCVVYVCGVVCGGGGGVYVVWCVCGGGGCMWGGDWGGCLCAVNRDGSKVFASLINHCCCAGCSGDGSEGADPWPQRQRHAGQWGDGAVVSGLRHRWQWPGEEPCHPALQRHMALQTRKLQHQQGKS